MSFEYLSTSSPESLGIPSAAIESFLKDLTEKRLCLHGFMLIRHGKIAAEGYCAPFEESKKHRMYSISKTFTSIAIGMMIDEGKITPDSRPADIFPEYLPENPHRFVMEATIRDLLIMATYNTSTSYSVNETSHSPDFSETFFNDSGPKHKPGQFFCYDTAASTVLCAIVEKLSGKKMLEYMRPVLDEIGFSKDAWCIEAPEGRSWTGSGILCTQRDLARFALLCMNGGEWNGKQLLNREYLQAATSNQIDNFVANDSCERGLGYGYQIWCMREGGFAMNGMGSQHAMCMPKYDTILIITADTQDTPRASDFMFDAYYRLLKTLSPDPLPEDKQARENLQKAISEMSIPLPPGKTATPRANEISGKTYVLDENRAGMKWLRFIPEENTCRLQYENKSGIHELVFGMGRYEPQLFPEKYFGKRIGVRDTQYRCIGSGAWAGDGAFIGMIYAVDDYLGSIKLQLSFKDNDVCGYMTKAAEWFFDEYQGFISGSCG